MDIRQLRYFIAIAEEKQITAAAKKLHMAQPPLSQQLKLLEQDLGVKLFEKRGRFLQLTDAGNTLYRYAMKITKDMEEAQTEVTQIGSGVRGKLSIGINTISYYPYRGCCKDLGKPTHILLIKYNKTNLPSSRSSSRKKSLSWLSSVCPCF
ncbi:LysR family transcriptional regulator [Paenibacillus sedimenti]|uniref:LysR family transcriptional regulator n=1 Tax=Paenibacillus sedimenti TaxID=2770274 RepID=UPI0028A10C09|nr:LysR family transcriptional regulator [Paenibacillus sedimenti]